MPYYVKVTPKVKEQILPEYVKKPLSKDGNYLLFQNDLIGIEGNTLMDRVNRVGGALLTPEERKAESDGTTDSPAYCYTPKEYGGTDETTDKGEGSFETAAPTNKESEVNNE